MILNVPNVLTLARVVAIPVFVALFFLPGWWAKVFTTAIFVAAAVTDWLDGYLARRLNQTSPFGAFLDPVADKLIVAAALVLLATDPGTQRAVFSERLFGVVAFVIIGREITVSALREWMAELGRRAHVAVSGVGKLKTTAQMTAIPFMLYRQPLGPIPVVSVGEALLYVAALLTLWSMFVYLRAAWPALTSRPSG
jgi:CDP-diacylglycerol--glycerol-3-phosphate 3-phosphatidyltransferase